MKESSEGRMTRESEALYDFWSATADGVLGCLRQLPSTWYSSDGSHWYANERKIFEKYVNPLWWGAASTMFVFVTLRATGTVRFQQFRQKYVSSYKAVKQTNGQKSEKQYVSYLEQQRNKKEKEAVDSIKGLTDAIVSMSVGVSASLLLLDAEKETFRTDFERAPLVAGRSVIASVACPIMTETAEKHGLAGQSPVSDDNLRSFLRFVENCSDRRQGEQEIQ